MTVMLLRRVESLAVTAIVAGWATTVAGSVLGWRMEMGHHHVIEAGGSVLTGPVVFLAGWMVMVAAMMLPSSLGTIRWFGTLSGVREARTRRSVAFLAGYGAVWGAVGVAALTGDAAIHDMTHRWAWLGARPWLIAGGALLIAGTFQLTAWSRHCRSTERRHVRSAFDCAIGTTTAITLGAEHGMIRLRECWPVMLLSFAFGMTSLIWMAGLTALMIAERSPRLAARTALASGAVFLVAAALVLLAPGRLPAGLLPA